MSESQKAALVKLRSMQKLFFYDRTPGGIKVRTKPLLVGPSGCGKTTVIKQFADELGLKMLTLNAGNWIPRGAKDDGYSLDKVAQFVSDERENGGLIFLDEVDKSLPHNGGFGEWSNSIFSELLALLDADHRLLCAGWDEWKLKAFCDGFYVIGAGAWQSVKNNSRRVAGFASGLPSVELMYDALNKKSGFGIPDEVAQRFSSNIIFISYPSQSDFVIGIKLIHEELGLALPSNIDELSQEAVEAERGVRWLETYLTKLLMGNPSCVERHIRPYTPPLVPQLTCPWLTKGGAAEKKVDEENKTEPTLKHMISELHFRCMELEAVARSIHRDKIRDKRLRRLIFGDKRWSSVADLANSTRNITSYMSVKIYADEGNPFAKISEITKEKEQTWLTKLGSLMNRLNRILNEFGFEVAILNLCDAAETVHKLCGDVKKAYLSSKT